MKPKRTALVAAMPRAMSGWATRKAALPAPRQRSGVVATAATGPGAAALKTGTKPSSPCQ
jgi:hypothetical protein